MSVRENIELYGLKDEERCVQTLTTDLGAIKCFELPRAIGRAPVLLQIPFTGQILSGEQRFLQFI